jgi:DNA-binding response OmpR family regulator
MKPLTLLMIGDSVTSCQQVVNLLRSNGYQAEWMVEQDGVVDISDEHEFDIYFLDLISAARTSCEIAGKIRELNSRSCILIGIDESVSGARLNAFAAGADNFIYSPYHSAELLACLNSLSRWIKD